MNGMKWIQSLPGLVTPCAATVSSMGAYACRLAAVLLLLAGGLLSLSPDQALAADDGRVAVELNEADKEAFLTEMRSALSALHNVMTALAAKDMAALAEASTSGEARIHERSKELLKKLPDSFRAFSRSVRQGFVEIGRAANEGQGHERIVALMAEQIGRCVACHATYRLK